VTRTVPFARWLLSTSVLFGVLFLCAGGMDNLMLNIYLAVFAVWGLIVAIVADRSLDRERRNPNLGRIHLGSRGAASFLFLATVMVAALDTGRFHWTHDIGTASQLAALVVLLLAAGLQILAMAVNPFFSTAIRIQTERGHRVINRGPYRYIRHPGYLAMALSMPATAIALCSAVALIPAMGYSFLILLRILGEDRFLKESLPGYSGYSGMVRYRLIPGLW